MSVWLCHEIQHPHSHANVAGMFSIFTQTRVMPSFTRPAMVPAMTPATAWWTPRLHTQSLYGCLEKQVQLPPLGAPISRSLGCGYRPESPKVTSGQLLVPRGSKLAFARDKNTVRVFRTLHPRWGTGTRLSAGSREEEGREVMAPREGPSAREHQSLAGRGAPPPQRAPPG